MEVITEGRRWAGEWVSVWRSMRSVRAAWGLYLHAVVSLEVMDELLGEVEVVGQGNALVWERVGELPASEWLRREGAIVSGVPG